MILAPLAGIALVVSTATGPIAEDAAIQLSPQQKSAAMRPLVRSATECIAHTVAADPRFGSEALGDLIVVSMASCVGPVRAMVEAYDRLFGASTGEAFFMGPYLDILPTAVTKWIAGTAD